MKRAYKYRLYPSTHQEHALAEMLETHRQLYNAALQERRAAWKTHRLSLHYYSQANQLKALREEHPSLKRWNYSSYQQTLRRVQKAFDAFFRRINAGKKQPGYPRYKSRHRFKAVEFRFGDGIRLTQGRLTVQGIGDLKVKWHRPLPDEAIPKAVMLKRDSDGHWYAIFQLALPLIQGMLHFGPPVGIDLGVTQIVALSNGQTTPAPRYLFQRVKKLRRQQRTVSRRKKGSKRWKKAQLQVAKTHAKIANQRRDFWHKVSRSLVCLYGLIAVEALNINGLVKSFLAKQILDAGWGMFLHQLEYKAVDAGAQVVQVPPWKTSQVCAGCGQHVPKSLSVRVHRCPTCGLVVDRDVNGARNVLLRALSPTAPIGDLHSPPGRGGQTLTYPVADCVV